MNNQSPLYKALEARGAGRRLSPDFSSRLMCEIRVAEHRRRRRDMWWSIVGYAVAAVVAVVTLVYYCSGIFTRMVHNTAVAISARPETGGFSGGAAPDNSVLMIALLLVCTTSILLVLDYFLRKKLLKVKIEG